MSLASRFGAHSGGDKKSKKEASQGSPPKRQQTFPRKQPDKPGSSQDQTHDITKTLAALTLRHEDAINVIQQDLIFILHMTTEDMSILDQLARERSKKQERGAPPQRQRMAQCLVQQLSERAQTLVENQDAQQEATKEGILQAIPVEGRQVPGFPFEKWDAEQVKLT